MSAVDSQTTLVKRYVAHQ